MGKTKSLQQLIVGKTKQAVGEIIGDQDLHDDGKAQAAGGRDEQDKPVELDPLKKLKQLT
ncbi:CsbD family protein [Bradyrhizobium japonicum]|uniref:CsbD family protein n=1 Tax=Bradyrhizobium japonicum TaxID=375 RepID=UPI001BA5A9F1|nr:CsbD family protein [Bradyrhizobium japonicum]MBR0995530.1 CsbD family protein [Bradyrhizobium japonicum]